MRYINIMLILLFAITCSKNEDQMLSVTPEVIKLLEALKAKKKFTKDSALVYFGAPNEPDRVKAEGIINEALSRIIEGASSKGITEKQFWKELEIAAKQLSDMDSEEMDRGLSYMEDIMDIFGIKSSGGRLNKWRYGFDPEKAQ